MRRLLGGLLCVAVLAACSSGAKSSSTDATDPTTAPATPATPAPALTTTPPPWPAPTTDEAALIAQAGLPLLPSEALNEHIHAHLDVFYDGQPVTVPAYIGIVLRPVGISPLHTHDTSGIVHVESATVRPFYLGQLFTEWGVAVGGTARPASVYVNGTLVQTPVAQVEITSHAEIAVVIGAPPAAIPSTYQFPSGY